MLISLQPWCLVQGDIASNVQALRDGPDALETTAWKVQKLARQGSNSYELLTGLQLLREALWATTCTEQQHASAEQTQRHHPDMRLEALLVRVGLHSLRRLVPEISREEQLVAKLRKKLDVMMNHQSSKVTGMMIFKELVEDTKERAYRERTQTSVATYRTLLQNANAQWPQLPAETKRSYEEAATRYKMGTDNRWMEASEEILGSLQLAHQRFQGHQQSGHHQPLQFSACQLTPTAIELWQLYYDTMPKERPRVFNLLRSSTTAPEKPPPNLIATLSRLPVQDAHQSKPKPKWLSPICHMRDGLY